ncbi:MAG: helix-turn-helix domain-containing protein [Flavobacteriales bacterium]|nr:helix-turn-helix domain-containing protein [Flavobacteriales bacterium]
MRKQFTVIGQQLKALRQQAGYTSYAGFAWDNDLPKTQYGRMEKGTNCTLKSLQRVLDIHGLSFGEFFELVESKTSSV